MSDMIKDKGGLRAAAVLVRHALGTDGCYECGEVEGSTMVLVQLVASGIITDTQIKNAAKSKVRKWEVGIEPGPWKD